MATIYKMIGMGMKKPGNNLIPSEIFFIWGGLCSEVYSAIDKS